MAENSSVQAPIREDTVQSAVQFLRDPSVAQASLARKVTFLESKNLTSAEIDEAIRRVNGSTAGSVVTGGNGGSDVNGSINGLGSNAGSQLISPPSMYYPPLPPPPPQQYGWKDYTLATVGTIGAGYGLMQLFKHIIQPMIGFPTGEQIEKDKTDVMDQLSKNSATVESIENEFQNVARNVDQHASKLNTAILSLTSALSQLKEFQSKQDLELKRLRDEMENIRRILPKAIDKSKESDKNIIVELQAEVKSLKTLLTSLSDSSSRSISSPNSAPVNTIANIPPPSSSYNSEQSKFSVAVPLRPTSLANRSTSAGVSSAANISTSKQLSSATDNLLPSGSSSASESSNNLQTNSTSNIQPPRKIPNWQLDEDEDNEDNQDSKISGKDSDNESINGS